MKPNFKGVYAITTKFLGVKMLDKNDQGKETLTAEQEEILSAKFGKSFTDTFKEELAAFQTDHEGASNEGPKIDSEEIGRLQAELAEKDKQLQAAMDDADLKKMLIDELSQQPNSDNSEQIGMRTPTTQLAKPKFAIDMNHKHNRWAMGYISGDKSMQYSGDSTIDAKELKEEFGKYVSSGQLPVFKEILDQLDMVQSDCVNIQITDKEEWRAGRWIIDHVLQQFKPVWSPTGKVTVTPITIKNYIHKVNTQIIPTDLMSGYLGYLYKENLTASQQPLTAYLINNILIPKLKEDLEFALCLGKFVEDTDTTSGKAAPEDAYLKCMDGVVTILQGLKAKAGNKVTWLSDGVVLTDDNIVDEMAKAVDSIPYKYKNTKAFVYCDPQLIVRYKRAYEKKFPNTKNEDKNNYTIDYTNFTFKPIAGLDGTGVYFITPKDNFILLCSPNGREFKFYMQDADYVSKIFMEFRLAPGFAVEEILFVYLPPAKGSDTANSGMK